MGNKVSKEDYKYCSKIKEGLHELLADSSNKYGYSIKVAWIDCANAVEDENGKIHFLYLVNYCTCKDYIQKLSNAKDKDSLLYHINLNNE